MRWNPIDVPVTTQGPVLIYHPGLDADKEFPGHPIQVSNPEYVRVGNAARAGYTLWAEIELPE